MVQDQPMSQVEIPVDRADEAPDHVPAPDWRIPYARQDGHNLSMALGLPATLATTLVTVWGLFTLASGDPGFAWFVLLTVWSLYVVLMVLVWFATVVEPG
jgi:hypothetical protein